MSKLLLAGPASIHLWRYYQMVKAELDDIAVITDADPGTALPEGCKITVLPLSLRHPFAFARSIRIIRKLIDTYQPDIIHCHMANTAALAVNLAKRGLQIPTVLTAWGSDILIAPFQNLALRKLVRYNLKQAKILTSDSRYMADRMQELVPEKRLDLRIANFGIGVRPDPSVAKENLIYSNRLHESLYRIDAILRAFKQFTENAPETWTLVIAGTGSQTPYLKKLVQELKIKGRVRFVGWLSAAENEAYYNRAKLYVSIPESDATSISLLESMACRCIPIVSNLPANREWVKNGMNGVIVDDVTSPFFQAALDLDAFSAQEYNRKLIERWGTVKANRAVFRKIYLELTESNK
ncbi:MAG: glycosyltransferase [Desulfosporosinus sp.]|jgi:glycosyltransferase involved in cell wall biosynthesis